MTSPFITDLYREERFSEKTFSAQFLFSQADTAAADLLIPGEEILEIKNFPAFSVGSGTVFLTAEPVGKGRLVQLESRHIGIFENVGLFAGMGLPVVGNGMVS